MNGTPIQASDASAAIITAYARQFNTYTARPSARARLVHAVGIVSLLVFPPLVFVALWVAHR